MARPWQTLERADTPDGPLELRRRGEGDFLITVSGRVLMNSRTQRSELELARIGCDGLADRAAPRVLLGGLGMGCSLRAALDALPARACVVVSELNPVVARWCRGALATLNGAALDDPRVRVDLRDVAEAIAEAGAPGADRYDAILLDLYEGPHPATQPRDHPHYGGRALARARAALRPGGRLAIWSEDPDTSFEQALRRAGYAVTLARPGRGGRRHAVYCATAPGRGAR